MKIGVPKEIKSQEGRVAMTPGGVVNLLNHGHEIVVETNAGKASGFPDEAYEKVGAIIVDSAEEAWDADMVMKVKEPLEEEYKYFREGLILFTYLHLAPATELTDALLKAGVTSIAYETMELHGTLPLLTPMSEVAGRYAVQVASQYLETQNGGSGILLGAVPGVERGKVVIIGGGVVGLNAAKMAIGLGANVIILDTNAARLAELENIFGVQIETLMSDEYNIAKAVKAADVVIGSVLIAGKKAPVLVKEETVKEMRKGSVMIDIAIDQGGNFETSTHATSHEDPVYVRYGVTHYAVANIPGAVPRTSTFALTNVTNRYAMQIANMGIVEAAKEDHTILTGINTYKGKLTNKAVAESQNREVVDVKTLF